MYHPGYQIARIQTNSSTWTRGIRSGWWWHRGLNHDHSYIYSIQHRWSDLDCSHCSLYLQQKAEEKNTWFSHRPSNQWFRVWSRRSGLWDPESRIFREISENIGVGSRLQLRVLWVSRIKDGQVIRSKNANSFQSSRIPRTKKRNWPAKINTRSFEHSPTKALCH